MEARHGGARRRRAEEGLSRYVMARRGAQGARSVARPAGVQRRVGQALRGRDGEGGEPRSRRSDAWRSSPGRRTRTRSTASSISRCRKGLDTMFVAQLLHNDEKAVGRILADPDTHISLSDAGAHLTFFCDAGFGLHLMGHWSRDLGVLDLPQAVHRLTGQPAKLFGLQGPRAAARRLCRRPDAVRSQDGGARSQATRPRPAGRCGAAHRPRRSACTASGSTAPRSPTTRASAPIPRRGRARSFATSQASLWPA